MTNERRRQRQPIKQAVIKQESQSDPPLDQGTIQLSVSWLYEFTGE